MVPRLATDTPMEDTTKVATKTSTTVTSTTIRARENTDEADGDTTPRQTLRPSVISP
jgi:hypothetical protein